MPKLLIGLGNPGDRHSSTRHNAGFWLADAVAAAAGADFSPKSKFNADVAVAGGVRALKPRTWMNNSGETAAAAAAFYAAAGADILVAHDEADLPPGKAKFKFGGGAAGHNGVADISRRLGGDAYWRLRIGIGRPLATGGIHGYVLAAPPADERARIDAAIADVLAVWQDIAADNYERAMARLHAAPAAV